MGVSGCGSEETPRWGGGATAWLGGVTEPGPLTGGIAHGPRGPTSYYYMLPMKVRVLGLKVALTVKMMQVRGPLCFGGAPGGIGDAVTPPPPPSPATCCVSPHASQDDLHIVDSLEIPTADPQYLVDLAQYRHWGHSVLIVDV